MDFPIIGISIDIAEAQIYESLLLLVFQCLFTYITYKIRFLCNKKMK